MFIISTKIVALFNIKICFRHFSYILLHFISSAKMYHMLKIVLFWPNLNDQRLILLFVNISKIFKFLTTTTTTTTTKRTTTMTTTTSTTITYLLIGWMQSSIVRLMAFFSSTSPKEGHEAETLGIKAVMGLDWGWRSLSHSWRSYKIILNFKTAQVILPPQGSQEHFLGGTCHKYTKPR